MITQGVAFVGRWPTAFTDLARGRVFGIANLLLWLLAATGAAFVLLKWTRLGAHMIATGEADEAARLAGIATARMKRIGLSLSGLFAAITAVLLAANLSSAAPNMAGDYFLYAIAAVLLGMTMFEPGRPNVLGTVVAALVSEGARQRSGVARRRLLCAGHGARRDHHRFGRVLGQCGQEGCVQGMTAGDRSG